MHSDDRGLPEALEAALADLRSAGSRLERAVEAHAALFRASHATGISSAAQVAAAHEVSVATSAAREAFVAYLAETTLRQ